MSRCAWAMLMPSRRFRNEIDRRLFGSPDRDFDHLRGGTDHRERVLGSESRRHVAFRSSTGAGGAARWTTEAGGALSCFVILRRRGRKRPSAAINVLADAI